jgi:hypothetical protein
MPRPLSKQEAFDLLFYMNIQSQSVLIFGGDEIELLATLIMSIDEFNPVTTVSSDESRANHIQRHDGSLGYVGRRKGDPGRALARDEVRRRFHGTFNVILCMGRPDVVGAPHLAEFLRGWSHLLSPGGRIFVEMHRIEQGEPWRQVEARYRSAADSAIFRLMEINGTFVDDQLDTEMFELSARADQLRKTANLIEPVDKQAAVDLRQRAADEDARTTQMKAVRGNARIPLEDEMLEDILGGRHQTLYAMLRR